MVRRSDIENEFRVWLDRIGDEDLRRKTVDVWALACERAGWESWDEVRKIPFTLLTETRGIDLVSHTLAVTVGAWGLAQAQKEAYRDLPYPIDEDRLIAGGLLHDVGKVLEIEPDGEGGYRKSHGGRCARHPISGALLAHEAGMSPEMVNVIACHAKEGDGRPQVVETVLIHQADFATFNPLVMLKKGDLITN